MTTQTTLTKPDNLDTSILHHPSVVRQWKADTADYFQALRNIEQAELNKAKTISAYENRILSEDEYFALKVKQKTEQDEKQAEREAAAKATALAEIDRLMASPPTVEVLHRGEFQFISEVIMYANRGYELADLIACMPGLYHCTLSAPVAVKKGGK